MLTLSLNENQLNNLFAYFILLDKNLKVVNCSPKITQIIGDCKNKFFYDLFEICDAETVVIDYQQLLETQNQDLALVVKNGARNRLIGKFIQLSSESLLFAGSVYEQQLMPYNTLATVPVSQANIFSQIVENNINSVIITDLSDHITWVNKSFTDLTQFTLEEAIGKKPEYLLGGKKTSRKVLDYLNNKVAEASGFNSELINYKKDGTMYWGRITGQTITDDAGQHVGFFSFIEDVTAQKQTEERIEQSEKEFRLALEKISHLWEYDFVENRTIFSKGDAKFLGISDIALEQQEATWWGQIHKDDFPLVEENLRKYKAKEITNHTVKYRFITIQGETKWILDQGVIVRVDEDENPLKLIGTHTDITSIKETEESLERSVYQFKSLSEHLPIVLYEYEYRQDGSDGMRYISPAIEQVVGLTPDEFWDKKIISEVNQRRINRKQQFSRRTLKPFYDECIINTPVKGDRWYAISSVYSYKSAQNALIFTGFMVDITERKAIEDSIRVNEEKYRNILASMKLGMLEVDNQDMITYANKSFCEMSGYKENELLGNAAEKLFPSILNEEFKIQSNEKLRAFEFETTDKAQTQRWWMVSMAPRFNEKTERVGTIGIYLDITEGKLQEIELIKARINAENLAQTKEIFLANMSHEMRTPMHAIMSMTSQLNKTSLDSNQNFYLETIKKASKGLLVLINDVLDLSKIEAGKLNLEDIGFDLNLELLDALKVVTHKAELKGLELNNLFIRKNIHKILVGDPHRLKQVLINLLTNAIKFTEKGSVDVNCILVEDQEDAQLLELSIQDTGIGMDEQYVRNIFEKFSQENNSISRKYGGTGLGMSITKSLIEQMGGTIQVESKKNHGTKITLQVTFKKGTEENLPEVTPLTFADNFLEGRKILVTDDNDLNRLVASVLLLNYGATVLVAEDGEDALEMIRNNHFDLVLMDVQMPVLNGYETTKILRAKGNQIPIIALTASAIDGEMQKCLAAGMDDYVTKPIEEALFLSKILKWIAKADLNTNSGAPGNTEEPLYSLESLIEISKGREDFVLKMVDLFCSQMPGMVQEMKSAYENQNFLAMGSVAHKLKSNIDHLKITRIQRIIRKIEELGNEQINDSSLENSIELVEGAVKETIAALQAKYKVVS